MNSYDINGCDYKKKIILHLNIKMKIFFYQNMIYLIFPFKTINFH